MRISRASVIHKQVPVERQVKTAFGVMDSRHAVFLVLEDDAGRRGLGESWVNFPLWAPQERVVAFERAIIPWLEGRDVADAAACVGELWSALLGPARQSGTRGPLLSAVCAVELALWDLAAQREEKPLAQLLFDSPAERVRVYASGINAPLPLDLIDEHLALGVELFKLKLGFGDEEDRRNLEAIRSHLGDRARLAVDVNRGWDFETAARWMPVLAELDLEWIEEPLSEADESRLSELAEIASVPLSGGENIMTPPGCDPAIMTASPFAVLQPDLTKYNPLSVSLKVLRAGEAAGKRVVPHFLGSGPGQAASLHFAAGCPGALCELDINRNALRTDVLDEPFTIEDGSIRLPDRPGLGWNLKAAADERR